MMRIPFLFFYSPCLIIKGFEAIKKIKIQNKKISYLALSLMKCKEEKHEADSSQ